MVILEKWGTSLALGAVVSACFLAGCTTQGVDGMKTASISKTSSVKASYGYTAKDRECLARAMFFESNRSSREGLVAVGTVVMNRLQSGEYGDTVCQVVGQKGQFAPGVLSRKMDSKALPDVVSAADSVLKGERHPAVKNAMFFHTAGLRFPYKNMHYVLQAGGNSFYEKRSRHRMAKRDTDERVANAAARQDAGAAQTVAAVAPRKAEQPAPTRAASVARRDGAAVVTEVPVVKAASAATQGATLQQASVTNSPIVSTAAMSYEADPKAVDAIGKLIATQNRPLPKSN